MKTRLFSTIFALFLVQTVFAQEIPYEFSVLQQEYNRLDNPTFLTEGVWDDPGFVDSIGFDFVIDSVTYNSFVMSNDDVGGFLYFAPSPVPQHLLVAHASDLIDPGYNDNKSLGYIASQIEGEPGNRIYKIEWNNVGFYNEVENAGTANNLLNFQVWLYEGSNDIEWHFGVNTIKDPAVHDLGGAILGLAFDLNIESGDPGVLYSLSGDPSNPDVNTLTDFDTYPPVLDSDPVDGTVYRFSSLYVSTRNLPEVASTIQISPTIVQQDLNMQVDIKNNEQLDLAILDLMGRDWSPTKTVKAQQTLDLSALPVGMYFVNVRAGEAVWTQKIVKK